MPKKLKNAPKLRTRLVNYLYDLLDPEQAALYSMLSNRLTSQGYELMRGWGSGELDKTTTGEVELDCSCLFDNQWNTTEISPTNKNYRVFDWHESIVPNGKLRSGHYLIITDEMKSIRANTLKCGYCGAMEYDDHELKFCPHCLGSEFLKEEDLHFIRMLPVSFKGKRQPLTELERAVLLPLYVAAQTEGADTRAGKKLRAKRLELKINYSKTLKTAKIEFKGFTWLMDHGINIDNCIYYDHKDTFAFGWKSPLSDSVKEALKKALTEFPYSYEFSTK